MSELSRLARGAAAKEIGRRYPFVVLGSRVFFRYLLPLAVLAAIVAGVVYGLRRLNFEVPAVSPWWLAIVPAGALLVYLVRAAGARWDVWWRLRMALRAR